MTFNDFKNNNFNLMGICSSVIDCVYSWEVFESEPEKLDILYIKDYVLDILYISLWADRNMI